jgi:sulfate adenylyltransferase subunit 1 (EFTu-like GTPase family)
MITGSTRADAAVLLIDAHEGMMEQTRRHLYILNLLGVRKIVAAINKMDAVGYRQRVFELRQRELLSFFNTAGIAVPQVIPVSARKGDNILRKSSRMSWYGGEPLLDVLDALTTEVCAKRSFRLPVQDTYRVRGKNILVGRIVSGTVSRGQVVVVLPSRQETVVESIEIFGRVPRRAYEGESIGITLTHLCSAGRGDVIVGRTNLPVVSDRFQSNVFWLAKAPLRLRRPMILQCLTQQVECFAESIPARIDTSSFQVIERNASELKSNEAGCVVLKTVRPLVIERFETAKEMGRFTLEYNGCVAAAGVVL